MPNVLIPTSHGQMLAWLALPILPTPRPGVVVLHDIFGMNQDHRHQANWLAQAGLLALSIDLYSRGGPLRCMRAVVRDLIADSGPDSDDIEVSRNWLQAHPRCNGRVGVVGLCMGGGFALLLARGNSFSPVAGISDDKLPPEVDNFLQTDCPVVGNYNGQAKWEQGLADQLEDALQCALVPHNVKASPEAGHGFRDRHHRFFLKLLRLKCPGYDEPEMLDARRRILAFFHTHLGDRAPAHP